MKTLRMWLLVLLMLGVIPLGVRAAEGEFAQIPVRVLTEGADPEEARYTLLLLQGDRELQRLTLKAGEEGCFSVPLETTGAFDYRICQLPGEDPSCTYDKQEYRLRLLVTRDPSGKLQPTAQLYGQEGEKEAAAVFCNRWAGAAEVPIRAWKTLDGNTPEDGAFTFRLLSEEGDVLQTVKNDGRRVLFRPLTFDREGVYRFFLKEAAGGNKKILYDRAVYTLTVTVTKDGDYTAQILWERNGKPWQGTPSFANYTDTGSPKTGDPITLWLGLLGFSAAGLAAVWVCRKKQ